MKTVSVKVLSLAYIASETHSKKILMAGAVSRTISDTLSHSSSMPVRNAEQEGGVLDKVIAPFVIIGSVGTIIYLFFHIRS